MGDEAFPLMDNLMKPFSRKTLNEEQAIFNYRLSRARRIVENAFGILASRFRILLREINLSPEKATLIVQACSHLHNFLRMKKIELYYQGGLDVENNDRRYRKRRLEITKNTTLFTTNPRPKHFCFFKRNTSKLFMLF